MGIKNEIGRTLVEMLGVLSIIGVLVVGSVSGIRFGMISLQASSVYSLIENTAAGVIDIYSWTDYPLPAKAKEMGERIVKSGDVCDECEATSNGAEAELPWDTRMIVQPGDIGYFKIVLQNVPQAACLKLSEMRWNYVEWQSPVTEVAGKMEPACEDETQDILFYSH